jgi:hypothetical protein
MAVAAFELFHRIGDPGSARVRRFVSEHSLEGDVRFRNLVFPEVERDFTDRGGKLAPALWDGERLIEGAEAAIARLKAYLDVGRS